MAAFLLMLAFLAIALFGATEALLRWRTAESRRDMATVVLFAAAAAGAFHRAWTLGEVR